MKEKGKGTKNSYKTATGTYHGNPIERIACPMCGWWRPVNYGYSQRTGELREVRFDKMDIETVPLWRQENLRGAGRGSKEASIELLNSKTLVELPEELKIQIKSQCHKILSLLGD